MNDAEILTQAASILRFREEARRAEVQRLFNKYVGKCRDKPHNLGKPNTLSPEEALLLYALEQNCYDVEVECPNGNRWHGDATCTRHTRGSAICMMANSRVELLWSLWATVSNQTGEVVGLSEDHLCETIAHRELGTRTCEAVAA